MESHYGQLFRQWGSAFDINCDDYSKLGSSTYHDDKYFALYENGTLVSEWTSVSVQDSNTGVEPCAVQASPTNTSVISPIVTNTISSTATISATPTISTTTGISLNVTFKSSDTNTTTNSPHPQFKIYNTGTSSIDLSTMEIRYWYEFEGSSQAEEAFKDYISRNGTDIGSYATLTITAGSFGANQDRYLKITFALGAGSLGNGQNDYLEAQTRFNKSDWSNYDQSNDWSFTTATSYTQWNKVGIYINGTKVWGDEPQGMLSVKGYVTPVEDMSESNVYSYPNPSEDVTNIRFSLLTPRIVKIAIFDLNSKLVWDRELQEREVKCGVNHIIWNNINSNGVDVANGVYLLRVISGEKTISKKIAVVR